MGAFLGIKIVKYRKKLTIFSNKTMFRNLFKLFLFLELNFLGISANIRECVSPKRVSSSSDVVKIGVLLPFQGDYPWVIQATFPAIQRAKEYVENTLGILPKYKFEINVADSACSDTIGPLTAIDMYINQSAHVFLGPACEYAIAPVARFSYYWGIPVLTAGAMVSAFKDKNEYKLLTRVQGPLAKGSEFALDLFTRFKWMHIAIVYSDAKGPNSGKRNCYFSAEAMFHHYNRKFDRKPFYVDFDENKVDVPYEQILKDCSLKARTAKKGVTHQTCLDCIYQPKEASCVKVSDVLV